MKAYRKTTGEYIEVSDTNPVGSSLTEVSIKPTPDHVFSDNWNTSPMNPAVCWTINLDGYKAKKRAAINAEAGRRIVAFYGLADGKQANMQKRGLEITRKRAMGITLTVAESDEEALLLTAGSFIDAVRSAARTAKQAVASATTVSQVDAVTVAWPGTVPPDWPV